ncbi:MAG: hypothetical protein MI750_13915 [Xanthomonadales bacterium]|nr:hypothetical protein [Xanthomonadales bacterium]
MKKRNFIVALSLLISLTQANVALAQDGEADEAAGNCSAAEYRAFDFWLGEWDVYSQGQLAGHNHIMKILDGCAISESWEGISGGRGHSLNAYDAKAGSWSQYWADSNGLVLRLVGEFTDGSMKMLGLTVVPGEEATTIRHQISWTPTENGHIRQLWESSPTGSDEWQVIFDGVYVPKGSPPPEVKTKS